VINNLLATDGYSSKNLSYFSNVLRKMERQSIGTYIFEAGCVEPGIDNAKVPLRKILTKLKK
ncbi:MAG: hypothetical protein PHV11_10185, partial [Candidatus Bipolaricaulis sp.]|nr:hypothetical protein [Candidatus Bipolaricaulis sp.]